MMSFYQISTLSILKFFMVSIFSLSLFFSPRIVSGAAEPSFYSAKSAQSISPCHAPLQCLSEKAWIEGRWRDSADCYDHLGHFLPVGLDAMPTDQGLIQPQMCQNEQAGQKINHENTELAANKINEA